MALRACAECGADIPPQQGSARPRKFCVVCRPPRNRPNPRVIDLPAPAVTSAEDEPALVTVYRETLEAADRLRSPEGAHVMHLAALFALGKHTAAGAAALSKELRAALDMAMRGAPKQADELDELAARRSKKIAGA